MPDSAYFPMRKSWCTCHKLLCAKCAARYAPFMEPMIGIAVGVIPCQQCGGPAGTGTQGALVPIERIEEVDGKYPEGDIYVRVRAGPTPVVGRKAIVR